MNNNHQNDDDNFYLTEEGYQAKESKLKDLRHELYEEIPEKLKEAKAHEGDLRENKEFIYLRERQDRIQAEISRLEHLLDNATIIDQKELQSDLVSMGTKVILEEEGQRDAVTYTLVSPAEADLEKNKISVESPVGEALMGHHQGEEITVQTPSGEKVYRILGIGK
ncbi:MAG: GreA/GreB family elongation factor [Candidatus Bipolaricaulota bacterium]